MYSHSASTFRGVEALLDYFHMERRPLPREVTTLEEAAAFLNDETDLILTPTELEGDWCRTAAGPFLVRDREGVDLAILPDWRGRCYFRDEGTGRRIYLTDRDGERFPTAYSAALDFHGTSVGALDVVRRMFRELSWYEGCLLLVWSLLGGGLWVLLARQVHSALAGVILTADRSDLGSGAGLILCVSALTALLVLTGRQIIRRVSQKGALAVLLGLGRRLYGAEQADDGAAPAMAALRDNGEKMMGWLLTALWQIPAILAILAALLGRSPAGFLTAALAAPVLYAAAAAVFLTRAGRRTDREADRRYWEWLFRLEADRRLGVERPFPGGRDRRSGTLPSGAAWPLAALLTIPMVYFALAGDYSAARLIQTVLLYLPGMALPLGTLLAAAGAGRALAEIRSLLPLAEKRPTGDMPLPPVGSVFELKDVSFSYPGRSEPVLRGVNLRLHPGETVGILGATGSGKTTLARLITGLARPTGGNIYYGGIELARYNGSALRRRVACGQGTEILLCRQLPEQRDGRTCVVFSTRAEALRGCDRVLRLTEGTLISE